MKRKSRISVRVALVIDALMLLVLGFVIFLVDTRLDYAFDNLIRDESLQIVSARSDELGRVIAMHKSQLSLLAIQPAYTRNRTKTARPMSALWHPPSGKI